MGRANAKTKAPAKAPTIPAGAQMPAAAQALAAVDEEIRGLAERALRRAAALAEQAQYAQAYRSPVEDYFPVRDGQPLAGADLDAWLQRAEDDAALRRVGRGVAYLLKQRELEAQGVSLKAWAKEQGLRYERVYEDTRVARMYGTLDEGAVRLSAPLNPKKQVLLASLPPIVIERMAEDGTLEQLADLTDRQAQALIAERKRFEKKLDQHAATIEQLREENRALKHTNRVWEGELPPSVQAARVDASVLAMEALDCLTRIEALALAVVRGHDLHADDDRRQAELRSALGPLAAQLAAVRAQADSALRGLVEAAGPYIPDTQPLLSEQEERAARERFELLMGELGRKKEARR